MYIRMGSEMTRKLASIGRSSCKVWEQDQIEVITNLYIYFVLTTVQSVNAFLIFTDRSRYYHFEEYLTQWYERLKSDEPTTMTIRLQKEIEKYKVNTVTTKYKLG